MRRLRTGPADRQLKEVAGTGKRGTGRPQLRQPPRTGPGHTGAAVTVATVCRPDPNVAHLLTAEGHASAGTHARTRTPYLT